MTSPTKVSVGDIVFERPQPFSGNSLKFFRREVYGIGVSSHRRSPGPIGVVLAIHDDRGDMSRLYLLSDLSTSWYGPFPTVQVHPQR